jgi:hypothetical protein
MGRAAMEGAARRSLVQSSARLGSLFVRAVRE